MQPLHKPRTPDQALMYLVEECSKVLEASGRTLRLGPFIASNGELNMDWLLREIEALETAIRVTKTQIAAWRQRLDQKI